MVEKWEKWCQFIFALPAWQNELTPFLPFTISPIFPPCGAASAAGDIACQIANHLARESVAVTCADASEDDWFAWSFCGGPAAPLWQATRAAEEQDQAALLRHIIGNPFHPVTLDPSWLNWNGRTVARLARAIDEQGDCAPLPILADALEEASCTDTTILEHCRDLHPHVRGCWLIDLLLSTDHRSNSL